MSTAHTGLKHTSSGKGRVGTCSRALPAGSGVHFFLMQLGAAVGIILKGWGSLRVHLRGPKRAGNDHLFTHPSSTMTDSTRRRRHPRALGAILAAVLACSNGHGASAFVQNTFSLPSSATAATAAAAAARSAPTPGRPQQHPRHLAQTGGGACSIRSSTALAGALPSAATPTDHTDGWNPVDGVSTGTCSLVGSGPGDPDLLTVAGLRELQSADLVIADRLVSKEILGLVSRNERRETNDERRKTEEEKPRGLLVICCDSLQLLPNCHFEARSLLGA